MTRAKTGNPVGRPNSFKDEKLEWLDERCEEYRRTGDTGAFYTSVTQSFIKKFGYLQLEDVNDGELSEEEKNKKLYSKMRLKFANWFRNRTREKHRPLIDEILRISREIADARPRKKRVLQVYASQYYRVKIKPSFDAHWEQAKHTLPASERISLMTDWVRSSWEAESEEFREAFTAEFEAEYASAMERHRAGESSSPDTLTSAEARAAAWDNFDSIAVTLSDALAEYLGGPVFIMTTLPVGADNGEINVRMSQSRISKGDDIKDGTTSRLFPHYNREAYDHLNLALVEYGRAFFTEEECKSRIVTAKNSNCDSPDLSLVSASQYKDSDTGTLLEPLHPAGTLTDTTQIPWWSQSGDLRQPDPPCHAIPNNPYGMEEDATRNIHTPRHFDVSGDIVWDYNSSVEVRSTDEDYTLPASHLYSGFAPHDDIAAPNDQASHISFGLTLSSALDLPHPSGTSTSHGSRLPWSMTESADGESPRLGNFSDACSTIPLPVTTIAPTVGFSHWSSAFVSEDSVGPPSKG